MIKYRRCMWLNSMCVNIIRYASCIKHNQLFVSNHNSSISPNMYIYIRNIRMLRCPIMSLPRSLPLILTTCLGELVVITVSTVGLCTSLWTPAEDSKTPYQFPVQNHSYICHNKTQTQNMIQIHVLPLFMVWIYMHTSEKI